jgi:folylpolyglutamate synthase/dihydropteroate synthase
MCDHGMDATGYGDVNMAVEAALKKAKTEDLVLVCGSFFILSELNGYLEQT